MDERHAAPRSASDNIGTDPLHDEPSDVEWPPDTSHCFPPRLAGVSPDNHSQLRAVGQCILGYVAVLAGGLPAPFARPVAAQSSVGDELCGTPIVNCTTTTVPWWWRWR